MLRILVVEIHETFDEGDHFRRIVVHIQGQILQFFVQKIHFPQVGINFISLRSSGDYFPQIEPYKLGFQQFPNVIIQLVHSGELRHHVQRVYVVSSGPYLLIEVLIDLLLHCIQARLC